MSVRSSNCTFCAVIYRGFAADVPVYKEGALAGVQLRDVGIGKDGKQKDTFEPGREKKRPVHREKSERPCAALNRHD